MVIDSASCCLLAYVTQKPTKTGVSFTWTGAWEYDPMSGTGSAILGKHGRLTETIEVRDGDSSTFVAEQAEAPTMSIAAPPRYQNKWKRR